MSVCMHACETNTVLWLYVYVVIEPQIPKVHYSNNSGSMVKAAALFWSYPQESLVNWYISIRMTALGCALTTVDRLWGLFHKFAP